MCLQKSNLCTAFFLWRRLARSLAAIRCVSRRHPAVPCSTLCALARCLSSLSFVVFSAAFVFPFVFAPLLCSADPFFWGFLFLTATGVGPRQQRMLRCRSSSDPSVRLCRGESHSGASLYLPSCQVGCVPACVPFSFALTHTPCQL